MASDRTPPATSMRRVILFFVATLIVAVLTIVMMACGVAWLLGSPVNGGRGIYTGVICGLIAWLFVAAFHIRRERLVLAYEDREEFRARLQGQLEELGYYRARETGDRAVFRPAFHSFLFGGKIEVHLEEQTARMTGPKVCLESLWRNLRLTQQVEEVHRRRDSSCQLSISR